MSDKILQKNLKIWTRSSPRAALLIHYVDDSYVKECFTITGEPNLIVNGVHLHAQEGARKEALDWFKTLELEKVSYVIVYGVGLGYYYEVIEEWLKKGKDRHLVFLEDDLAVIHALLEKEIGTRILKNPKVQLVYFKDLFDEGVFESLYWHLAMKRFSVIALNSYKISKEVQLKELQSKIALDAGVNNALVDEYLKYGIGFHLNFYHNMLSLPDAYLGNDLFGKFKGMPAIICGAGPSLQKHLGQIEALKSKAIIFAGGSALNVLSSASLKPHFGAGLDPNFELLKRLSDSRLDIPFFYRNRIHYEALKEIKGERLYITGAGGFGTPQFFEERLGIEREWIDEGHNVINFIVEIASAMGCNPIIFLGMDLSFTDMKQYADGVLENAKVTRQEIVEKKNDEDKAIVKTDIFGKPVYTLWKWVAESHWMGKYAKEHPDISFINCTEGGIGFPDVPNQALSQVMEDELKNIYDLNNKIHKEIQDVKLKGITREKVVSLMEELKISFERTLPCFDLLIKDVEEEMAKVKAKGLKENEEALQSNLAALAETELMEEAAYRFVLESFGMIMGRLLAREAHAISASRLSKANKHIKKLQLKIKKLCYLRDVAFANAELIAFALKNS